MRKNNTALVTVVFCISMLMIFVIAGRQINSQVINKSKSVNKTQPSADLSETGILSAADGNFRQNSKARQSAVSVAPAVGADLGNETEPNNTFAQANPLGSESKIRGDIYPNGDLDWFSFHRQCGRPRLCGGDDELFGECQHRQPVADFRFGRHDADRI